MEIIHVKGDLFNNNVKEPYCYAHCISADFALGAGIAVEFDRRFNMRQKLRHNYPMFIEKFDEMQKHGRFGTCLAEGNVLNLVTKLRCFEKPTRKSVLESLLSAKEICNENGISTICMPKIAAGLDRRPWKETEADILNIWKNTKMKIYVFTL